MILEWLEYWGAPERLMDNGSPYLKLDPFNYSVEWNTLGALGTAPRTFTVEQACDYVIRYTTQQVESTGSVVAVPRITARLSDPGSGRLLQDAATMLSNLFGTGQRPFIWPEPRVIKGGSNFTTTLTDISNAANRVNLCYSGFKIFFFNATLRKDFYNTI